MDRDIEVITMDWEEAQLNVLNGDADGLLYMNENEARQHMFDFSDPFLETEFHFFVRSSDRSMQNVNDLRNKRIGLEQVGYPYVVLQNYSDINSVFILENSFSATCRWRVGCSSGGSLGRRIRIS